jgi:hypothetical protein
MTSLEELRRKRESILRLARRHGARNIRVFGSLARNEANESSDIDLLVDLEPGRTLLDWGALWEELEKLLACEVDVATEQTLRPSLRERALQEAIPL